MNLFFASLGLSTASAAQVEIFPGDDLVARTASLQPGDELILADGLYQVRDALEWSVLATEAAPVTIRAAEGATPIIEITPDKKGEYPSYIVKIDKSEWISIEGITIRGSVDWDRGEADFGGVRIRDSAHITITNSEIAQTPGTLLYLSNTNADITVENTRLRDTVDGYGVYVGCSDASCWTSSSRLSNNWIHGIGGDGTYAVWLSHGSQGISLTDNVIYGAEYRGVFLGSTEFGDQNIFEGNALWNVSNIGLLVYGSARIRNNIIFNIDGTGIYVDNPGRETFNDVVISFNTIANTTGWGTQLLNWYDASGMVFANNAVCNPVGYSVYYPAPSDIDDTATPPTDNVLSSNVLCGLVDSFDRIDVPEAVIPGAGESDFEDVEGWNFYPSSSESTLVNAADPSGDTFIPDIDFNGIARDGAAPEAGAYEWAGAGNPGWFIQEGFKELAEAPKLIEEQVGGGCCGDKGSAEAVLLVPLLGLGALRRRRRRTA
ncbi:MAG: hypothetical protein ACI8S6_002581 [Myxococcota bacterium]|jgi:hypothetical protein